MNRDYKLFLKDIEECVNKIEEYIKNSSEEEFKKMYSFKMLLFEDVK